jgi:hypothetical protein
LDYEVGAVVALLHEGGWTMVEVYAGLDISDKSTHMCVVDRSGAVVWSGACATDPEVIARTLKTRAAGLVRVVLETGPLSAFLFHGLNFNYGDSALN